MGFNCANFKKTFFLKSSIIFLLWHQRRYTSVKECGQIRQHSKQVCLGHWRFWLNTDGSIYIDNFTLVGVTPFILRTCSRHVHDMHVQHSLFSDYKVTCWQDGCGASASTALRERVQGWLGLCLLLRVVVEYCGHVLWSIASRILRRCTAEFASRILRTCTAEYCK